MTIFVPDPDARDWMRQTFLVEGAPLANPDHAHLRAASLGVLWTSMAFERRGKRVVGTAETVRAGTTWRDGRARQQVREWFGTEPDFIVTLDASYAMQASDAAFCALVEHELYHCAQARDEFGSPKFSKTTGEPIWTLAGHDFEEFVGVARRYGLEPSAAAAVQPVLARGPELGPGAIAGACGTCLKVAA